jgi:uncharacterized protein (DUF1501 family)
MNPRRSTSHSSRRAFIGQLGRGAALCALQPFASQLVGASMLTPFRAEHGPRALVLIQLEGGNDGFNTFVPEHLDDYFRLRPTLALGRAQSIRLADSLKLNRAAAGLESLFGDGKLAIVPNVACAGGSESHYGATEIWHTGSGANDVPYSGWAGRCLSHLQTSGRAVTARYAGRKPRLFVREQDRLSGRGLFEAAAPVVTPLRAAAEAGPDAALAEIAADVTTTGGTELYFIGVPGFDTHFRQAGAHENALRNITAALRDFQSRLEQRGVDGQVVTVVFSEFGRSLAENAQGGTDHGAGSPVFVCGTPVRGGLLNDGAAITTDSRQLFSALVEHWLGIPSASIFDEKFAQLDLLRAGLAFT